MRVIREPVAAGRPLQYVVMGAQHKGMWLFVRHQERDTWEIPGGHLEDGETPAQAARRELYEETGAKTLDLVTVCDYAVERAGQRSWGRLFAAHVHELVALPQSEIAEVRGALDLPHDLTYPTIQPTLFRWLQEVRFPSADRSAGHIPE